MSQYLENESQFEEQVVAHLSSGHRIIIRKNSCSHNGFIGRRKPDLVTIEENLEIVAWEIKSPRECSNNDRKYHFWFRHPTPANDYLRSCRAIYSSDTLLSWKIRGWCIVIDCELRYWIERQGNQDSWRLPFTHTLPLTQCGIAAPRQEIEPLKSALRHLNVFERWDFSVTDNIVICRGTLQ